jgi:hypothetical protein
MTYTDLTVMFAGFSDKKLTIKKSLDKNLWTKISGQKFWTKEGLQNLWKILGAFFSTF